MKRLIMMLILATVALANPRATLADPFDAGPAAELVIDAGPDSPEAVTPSEPVKPDEPSASEESDLLELIEKAEEDPVGLAAEVVQDVRTGDWRHAIAGILVIVMLGLSKAKVREKVKWFKGDRGGAALVLALGIGGGAVTALYAEGPLDWRLFAGALSGSFTAAGIYTVFKRLFWPKD